MASSSSSSPCAACKFLRRKCQPECVFAPYFPADQPHKFANVHKVFGASNATKLLNDLPPHQREDAANSLAYEADMRLRDPVYGCVGVISLLQHQLRQLQLDLAVAKSELSRYQSQALLAATATVTATTTTTTIHCHVQDVGMMSMIGGACVHDSIQNHHYCHCHHHHRHMFRSRSFDGGNIEEASLSGMNMFGNKGQLNHIQFQQYSDDRR